MDLIFLARHRVLVGCAAVLLIAGILISCGGTTSKIQATGMGTINVSLSDPSSCMPLNGQFEHVFITVRSVQAHTSASATDSSSGWQELAL